MAKSRNWTYRYLVSDLVVSTLDWDSDDPVGLSGISGIEYFYYQLMASETPGYSKIIGIISFTTSQRGSRLRSLFGLTLTSMNIQYPNLEREYLFGLQKLQGPYQFGTLSYGQGVKRNKKYILNL